MFLLMPAMDFLPYIFNALTYITAGLIIFFISWFVIRAYLQDSYQSGLIELKKNMLTQTLPLRLQAYERAVIFLERINPANLLLRLHTSGISIRELQHLALADIRAEYQHNLAQQLYVSNETWMIVKRLKEDTVSLINNAVKTFPADAPAAELSKAILTHLSGLEQDPYEAGLLMIKTEIQRLF